MSQLYKSALIILAFFSFFVCQSLNAETLSCCTNPHRAIRVSRAAPEFSISLASNPTTGYTWQTPHYDKHLLKLVDHQYQPATTKLVGAGGIDSWTFKVKPQAFNGHHVIKINMLYARAWDKSDNPKMVEFVVMPR